MESAQTRDIVEARFEIITPMFLGGADQKAEHLRPASFKGVLRFWWRAIHWGRFRKEEADDATALRKLHDEEARLFGAAAAEHEGKKTGGQGVFLLSVTADTTTADQSSNFGGSAPIAYLLGMGLHHFRDGLLRNAIKGAFTVRLRFRPKTKPEDRDSVIAALKIMGLLGGLGSRTRRGMGSMQLVELTAANAIPLPSNLNDYKTAIHQLIQQGHSSQPPFTAFSAQTKWAYLEAASAEDALKKLGDELGMYRSYGQKDKVFGKTAEKNFQSDHDEMYKAATKQADFKLPKRLIFGMPHNYFFSSNNKKVDIQSTNNKLERRASPLFMHVHQLGNKYIGVALMLPAQFLPESDKVILNKQALPVNIDWQVVQNFLERQAFSKGTQL